MKAILLVVGIAMVVGLSGCTGGFLQDQSAVNAMIAESNAKRFEAFKDGMIGCAADESCKLGLSMAFAANLGQQSFYRAESVSDVARSFAAYVPLAETAIRMWGGTGSGDSSGGYVVTGDYNTFAGIGNKTTTDNGSTTSAAWTSTTTNTTQAWALDNGASYTPDESVENTYEAAPGVEETPGAEAVVEE